MAPSPRQVLWDALPALLSAKSEEALSVAVMVDPTDEEIVRALTLVDLVQLHGKEPPEQCRRFGGRVWKAFRIRQPQDLDGLDAYRDCVAGFLLDSYMEGVAGGTGRVFPWSYLEGRKLCCPTFLAGGLEPSNVAEACRVASVQGLDVSSGVESRPGQKDQGKLEMFFRLARPGRAGDRRIV